MDAKQKKIEHRDRCSRGGERNADIFLLMWHFILTLNEMSRSINDSDLALCNEENPSLPYAVPSFTSPCYF